MPYDPSYFSVQKYQTMGPFQPMGHMLSSIDEQTNFAEITPRKSLNFDNMMAVTQLHPFGGHIHPFSQSLNLTSSPGP